MAAPRRVELDKDVLAVVEDDLVKLLAHELEHALRLRLGDGLALERRLELAVEVLRDERVDAPREPCVRRGARLPPADVQPPEPQHRRCRPAAAAAGDVGALGDEQCAR